MVRVVAERAGTWLRRPGPAVSELRLPVRLVPPTLAAVSSQHYVAQGGSGVVVYEVGATAVRDGVRAGSWFFPGSPLPGGGKEDRLAVFGVPWDLADEAQVRLRAEDDAGNAAEVAFVDRFFPKPPARDTIALDDAFLSKVVTEIRQQTPELEDRGGLLENYLQINRDLRKRNAEELVALAPRTAGAFLWTEPFLPLRNAQVMSSFADQRTYVYQGKDVDAQTHLGFDLAAVARTPVPAANRGVVVLSRYLGIYGNTVVVDHGLRPRDPLLAPLVDRREGGRDRRAGAGPGPHRQDGPRRRGPPALHDARSGAARRSPRVVGRSAGSATASPRRSARPSSPTRERRAANGSGRRDLAIDLQESLSDLLPADLAGRHLLLALHLRLGEAQGVELAVPFRVGRRDAFPLLLLLTLRHPLLKAVLGVDQPFTGITHRSS